MELKKAGIVVFALALLSLLGVYLLPSNPETPGYATFSGDFQLESCPEFETCGSEPAFSVSFFPNATTRFNATCNMLVNASANSSTPFYDFNLVRTPRNQSWNDSIFNLTNSDNIANKSNVTMKLNTTIGNYAICIADLNMLLNANAESGDGTKITNWTSGAINSGQGTKIQNRSVSHSGNASFELSNSTGYIATSTGGAISWVSATITVQGDSNALNLTNTSMWSLSGWMKINATPGTDGSLHYVWVYIRSFAANGSSCGDVSATNATGQNQFYDTSGQWQYVNITNRSVSYAGACVGGGSNVTQIKLNFRMQNMTGYAWFDDFYLYQEYPARFNATTLPSPCTNLTTSYQNVTLPDNGVYGNDTVRLHAFLNCSETRPFNQSIFYRFKFNATQ